MIEPNSYVDVTLIRKAKINGLVRLLFFQNKKFSDLICYSRYTRFFNYKFSQFMCSSLKYLHSEDVSA